MRRLWCLVVGHVPPPWRPRTHCDGIDALLPPVGMGGYALVHYRCQRCGALVGP